MKFSKTKVIAILFAAVIITGASSYLFLNNTSESSSIEERPSKWVVPIDINGVPNFYKVTEDLYRGAQPTTEGIGQLKQMGIKTIVNLRSVHSDEDEIGWVDIGYEHIRFEPWNVDINEIERFLSIVTDETKTPIYVHCKYGADWTGFMCAVYRIAVCGWEKQAAIDEMVNGGFGFHPVWKNIIHSLENVDVTQLKEHVAQKNNYPVITDLNGYPR
jgi:protein tyrosine/serine phosphatase